MNTARQGTAEPVLTPVGSRAERVGKYQGLKPLGRFVPPAEPFMRQSLVAQPAAAGRAHFAPRQKTGIGKTFCATTGAVFRRAIPSC